MIRRLLAVIALCLLAYAFFPFIGSFEELSEVSDIAKHYLAIGPIEMGSANTVTAVVVSYRGFDTLGEIVVLFAASCGVALLFSKNNSSKDNPEYSSKESNRNASEILCSASCFLMPLLVLFGAYIFIHGHLSPGGGFQGGVIIASAYLLLFLSYPDYHIRHGILGAIESLSGLGVFVIAVIGAVLAYAFLDPRFLPLGKYGELLSAGAIPIIYSLIGLKVGSELTGVLDVMRMRYHSTDSSVEKFSDRRKDQ